MTAGEVIQAARGLDSSFHPNVHTDAVLRAFLTRYQRALAAKMIQRDRYSISAEIEIDLPLVSFDAGADLEASPGVALQFDVIQDASVIAANGDELPVWIVPHRDRYQRDRFPFAWIRQKTLYLGGLEGWWGGFTTLRITYAPTAVAVDENGDDLILPESALDVVTLAAGAEMARRRPELVKRTTLPAEAEKAETDFLNVIEEQCPAEVGTVRRVFS